MTTLNKSCKRCLLDTSYPNTKINSEGLCNLCASDTLFKPYGEKKLLKIFQKAKKKKRPYDALVPLSGGKDSTYVLYLATKVYGLNVLAYTFNNGFFSKKAIENIERSCHICNTDHVWFKLNDELLKKFYHTALYHSGEMCGICGIGIERAMLKLSEAWRTPLILLGHSPVEHNSSSTEDIYDQVRIEAILKENPKISKREMNQYFIYPKLNFIKVFLYSRTGKFGRKVNPFYYINLPSDKEISNILEKEMDWQEDKSSKYSRHFDCLAEPLTNYIRDRRLGFSRRVGQISNMIRDKEISRSEGEKIIEADKMNQKPENYAKVLKELGLSTEDLEHICNIPINKYEKHASVSNKIFALIRRLVH